MAYHPDMRVAGLATSALISIIYMLTVLKILYKIFSIICLQWRGLTCQITN